MVNPPILEATFASGIILIATGFYGTQFLINHSGSDMAKLAVETNSECLSMVDSSDYYADCTYKLEKIMKNLTESGEIRLEDCELDELDESIAYCPVWVWYYPEWLPMTDVTIVGVIGINTDTETIRPSPKLEKIFSKLFEASEKLTKSSDDEKMDRLNKFGQIFSSQSGSSEQISHSSNQGTGEYEDELDRIFSAMLIASQDLTEVVDRGETDSVDDDENILQNTLQFLTEYLTLNNFETLMESPELLKTLMYNFNTNDFEDPLSNFATFKLLLPFLVSSLGTNGADDTFNKLGLMSTFIQGLETEDLDDLLEKSGILELIVQHLETHYLEDVSDKSDIERALAENLKGNRYFENTLKSGITDVIAQKLQEYDSQATFGKFGFLKLLAPSLESDELASSLDKLGLIKEFLQNPETEDIIDLLEKSGLIGTLPHLEGNYIESFHDKSDLGQALVQNLKTNHYIDDSVRSDIMKQFVPNPGTDDKKVSPKGQHLISALQNIDTKDIQSPVESLGLLKFLTPSLKKNRVQNTFNNEIDTMSSLFQNLKKEDVEDFLEKSGLIEALLKPLKKNDPEETQNNSDFEQSLIQKDKANHYIGSSLNADLNKSILPNSKPPNPFSSTNLLKALAPSLDNSVLENPLNKLVLLNSILKHVEIQDVADFLGEPGLIGKLTHENYLDLPNEKLDLIQIIAKTMELNNEKGFHLPGELGLMQALTSNINSNNVQSNSLNNELLNTFSNQDKNYASMDTLDLGQTLGENLQQTDQETLSSGEAGDNFQAKGIDQESIKKHKEQNDTFSKDLRDMKLNPNLPWKNTV